MVTNSGFFRCADLIKIKTFRNKNFSYNIAFCLSGHFCKRGPIVTMIVIIIKKKLNKSFYFM